MTNVITNQDLMDAAKELGEQAGKGKDTQIKFLLKMAEGGYHNAIDLKPNKHGRGIDDAEKLAEAYYKAQTGSTVFDAKADNQRKLVSCLRTGIKIGAWPKGGNGEPLQTINNLMSMRQKLKQNPADAKRLQDAANTFLKYAREQLKRDTLIDDEELRGFCFKPASKDPASAEEVLENIRKQLDKLVKGNNHGVRDTSAEVIAARGELQKRLSAIARAKNPQIAAA
jgi:hypothetical protein